MRLQAHLREECASGLSKLLGAVGLGDGSSSSGSSSSSGGLSSSGSGSAGAGGTDRDRAVAGRGGDACRGGSPQGGLRFCLGPGKCLASPINFQQNCFKFFLSRRVRAVCWRTPSSSALHHQLCKSHDDSFCRYLCARQLPYCTCQSS